MDRLVDYTHAFLFYIDTWIQVTMGCLLITFTTEELVTSPRDPIGQPITPSRIYSEPHDQSSFELLKSISMTISDVKMQLSTIEETTRQHDEAFKHLEEAIHQLQRSQTDGELPKQKPKSHIKAPVD